MKLISFGEIIWDVYPDRAILGGAPFNFAAHAALQGADAYLLSAVGCDEYATRSLSEISVFGVNTDYVSSTDKASTGKCLVTLDKNGMPKYDVADPASYDYISFDENIPADFDVVAFQQFKEQVDFMLINDIKCVVNSCIVNLTTANQLLHDCR